MTAAVSPTHASGVSLGKDERGQPTLATADQSHIVALDAIGLAIWELCDGETTIDEIITATLDLFDAPEAVIRVDVTDLVNKLTQAGLLSSAGA